MCFRRVSLVSRFGGAPIFSVFLWGRLFLFHDYYSEAEEESIYSEELSGSEAAGGRRAEVAAAVAASEATSATTTRRSRGRPSGRGITRILLRGRPSSSTCSLWDDPGGAVAKEELLALGLSPDHRHECGNHLRPRLHVAPRVPVL